MSWIFLALWIGFSMGVFAGYMFCKWEMRNDK